MAVLLRQHHPRPIAHITVGQYLLSFLCTPTSGGSRHFVWGHEGSAEGARIEAPRGVRRVLLNSDV